MFGDESDTNSGGALPFQQAISVSLRVRGPLQVPLQMCPQGAFSLRTACPPPPGDRSLMQAPTHFLTPICAYTCTTGT